MNKKDSLFDPSEGMMEAEEMKDAEEEDNSDFSDDENEPEVERP